MQSEKLQRRIDAYLEELRRCLGELPPQEVNEILQEIRGHIFERAEASGELTEDVPTLKQVTDAAVPAIEPLRVRRLQRQHHSRQLRRATLDGQMEVVAHQAKGQHPQAKPLPTPNQPIEVLLPIPVIPEHRLALVASRDDVIHGPLSLQTQRPRHDSIIQEAHG